jgi:hypothetical protein
MLFDLRGKRRRAVQATYLMLAVLMGGGLVFFGIGGDVQGGLFDAFGGGSGGGDGNAAIEKTIERNQQRLERDPDNTAALKELVRAEYQLATAQTEASATGFPADARDELAAAGRYWQRYLEAEQGDPDPSLATVALQVYDVTALNRPREAARAASIIAADQNTSAAYIRLVQYATLAGDKRTANLAGQKAIDLAPPGQRTLVRQQVKQAKQTQAGQQAQDR